MNDENDVRTIELTIEEAQVAVEQKKRFLRLTTNKDFIEIIETGYFEAEAVRLVGALASPALQDEYNQSQMQKEITAVGRLRQYFYAIVQQGTTAERAIAANEQELELMRAEGLSE